ncbi:MAG: sodium:solute symporter family protein [Bacteroidota bacterium]|nr:sodium:solute symporter family protein [Bacteroidota bacterium]
MADAAYSDHSQDHLVSSSALPVQLGFSAADWIVVAAYFVFLLYLGFRGSALNRGSSEQFLLGGRMLSLPGFVAALVATWYGGILGVGEFSYLYGLANWFVFGFPYYVFAVIFAVFLAGRIRTTGRYSIPDQLFHTYDRKTGLLGSILVFFNSSPAPYLLMMAVLLQVVTGWPFELCLITGALLSMFYVFAGGFRAVVRTDLLQFSLMFGGFILLLAFLLPRYGLMPFLSQNLPPLHLTLTGGHTWQYILVWFFIALWTLVSPQFHQFTLSARSPRTARRGIFISVGFWFVFDSITTLSGLYARALLPDLAHPGMAYPLLAEQVLPSVAKGIFFVGMLATVMSTTDGLTFIAALTLGRDILTRWGGRDDDHAMTRQTQWGVVITTTLSVSAVLLFPSVIDLWYIIGTLFIPALLLPLAATYYPRFLISNGWTFAAMLGGFLLSMMSLTVGQLWHHGGPIPYPFGIEPMYLGLGFSVAVYGLAAMLRRRDRVTSR